MDSSRNWTGIFAGQKSAAGGSSLLSAHSKTNRGDL
jgi:hypothetical protein